MRDDAGSGAVPVLNGADLLKDVPGLDEFCEVDVHDFGQLPGPHMTPSRMMECSSLAQQSLADGFDAVLFTHGTDTLEETAYLLDLRHTGPKPIVFVGAMRTSSQLSWDGPINLLEACRVAADRRARDRGVMVVMNSTVFAASEVTKTYTDALDTFQSPDVGRLAFFDGRELIWVRAPHRRPILAADVETRVGIVIASAGDDGDLIDHCVKRGDRGLVIEALGRGNLPPAMAAAAKRAVEAGLLVVLTSRCWGGRVSGTYGYEGGGARLKELGIVFAPGIPGHKARILTMAALGAGMGSQELKQWLAD